jgi:putative transposase
MLSQSESIGGGALAGPRILRPRDGPINGEAFKTYVRNELLKTLKPGDIVVLDNLGSHKGKAVRNMIRNAGAHLMFLPPYSPDLNPIEQAFAKIKHLMRRAMERTVEAAQDRLVSVLDTIPPNECANYFSGAGYAATQTRRALARLTQRALPLFRRKRRAQKS